MLSSVGGADPFGGLDGYVYPDGVPPKRNRGWINPSKSETAPFESVPAPTITASAAHPGRKSNSCIPYTRVCSLSASRIAGEQGEVTFVSADQRALVGAGQARLSVCKSWQQLNAQLSNHELGTTTLAAAEDPFFAWDKVPALRDWRLDGVVLSNPDGGANENPTFDSIDGEMVETSVLNVCIGGVCSLINVFGTNCGDLLFLGLVATNKSGYWQFEYVPFTHTALSGGSKALALEDVNGLVGAWKLGRVLDSAAAADKWPRANEREHTLTINVAIEWIPTYPSPNEEGIILEAGLFERYSTVDAPAAPEPDELERLRSIAEEKQKKLEEARREREKLEEQARRAEEEAEERRKEEERAARLAEKARLQREAEERAREREERAREREEREEREREKAEAEAQKVVPTPVQPPSPSAPPPAPKKPEKKKPPAGGVPALLQGGGGQGGRQMDDEEQRRRAEEVRREAEEAVKKRRQQLEESVAKEQELARAADEAREQLIKYQRDVAGRRRSSLIGSASTMQPGGPRPSDGEFKDAVTFLTKSGLDYDNVYQAALRAIAGGSRADDVTLLRSTNAMLTSFTVAHREVVRYVRSNNTDADPIAARWIVVHDRVCAALEKTRDARAK